MTTNQPQKEPSPSRKNYAGVIGFLMYLVLNTIMLTTCFRIEVLNARAGHILPRHEYRNDDPSQGLVKWRQYAVTSEEGWRKLYGPKDADGQPVVRSLSTGEVERMHRDVARAKANNTLHDLVSSWGLLQYLLIPIVIIWSIVLILSSRSHLIRMTCAAFLIMAIACGAFMLYRDYFTSLGE